MTRRPRWVAALLATVLAVGLLSSLATGAQAVTPGIKNGDLSAGTGNAFDCFKLGGWGDHAVALTSVTGRGGTGRAAQLAVSNYASGDRKFMTEENDACSPAVTPGQTYDLSAWYTSTTKVNISVMRRTSAGWTYWTEAAFLPAVGTYTQAKATTPVVPAGTDAIAWGFTLSGNGTVVMDDFATAQTGTTPTPPPTSPPPATGGYTAQYWNNKTLTGTPVLTRNETAVQMDTYGSPAPGVNADDFSARWSTKPTLTAGAYKFDVTADDGIRVKVDGAVIIDAWKDQGPTAYTATTTLTAAAHDIVVEFYEAGGGAVAKFAYAPTTGTPPPPPTSPPPPVTTNGIVNGTLESGTSTPDCFSPAGWGDHTLTQGFSTDTPSGSGRSWSITIANRISGDRKLVPSEAAGCAPDVTVGQAYDLSIDYKSTVAVSMSVYRQTASGWEYWMEAVFEPARATWGKAVARTPLIPAGTARLSFGMSISTNGTLLTDNYAMTQVAAPTPRPDDDPVNITQGRWTVQNYEMPNRNLHTTLLYNGKVLMVAGDGNSGYLYSTKHFTAELWDPNTATFKTLATPADFFCAGHVVLADGRVLILGGTKDFATDTQAFTGLKGSFIFDPATEQFTKVNDAIDGHWYPTLTRLGTGDVYATGGYDTDGTGSDATELFSNGQQRWLAATEVKQANQYWGTYPAMHLLSDGRLFYSGVHTFNAGLAGSGASFYDINSGLIQDVPGLRDKDLRDQGASVLLPPAQDQRVMVAGGGYTEFNSAPTKTTDVIDLKEANPGYRPAGDLPVAKMYVNSVILPDRTVLTTGGGAGVRSQNVIDSEIFDPATLKWTPVAADPIGRGYHSSTVLLPDGRVVALGGNPADNTFEMRISIYEPGYMFKGARPTVGTVPATATYGSTVSVPATFAAGAAAKKVSLIAPMSVTHQSDPNARLVDVPFTTSGGNLILTIPTSRNILPPGPYMLFVTDSTDVPSIAKWVMIK
jgi:hypothetical protein